MNSLMDLKNNQVSELIEIDNTQSIKEIMNVCRALTPQFYKNKTKEETLSERMSIQLMIDGVPIETVSKMCKLAVNGYKIARSHNPMTYFDINFIMRFYVEAFNEINKLPDGAWIFKTNSFREVNGVSIDEWYSIDDCDIDGNPNADARVYVQRHIKK